MTEISQRKKTGFIQYSISTLNTIYAHGFYRLITLPNRKDRKIITVHTSAYPNQNLKTHETSELKDTIIFKLQDFTFWPLLW